MQELGTYSNLFTVLKKLKESVGFFFFNNLIATNEKVLKKAGFRSTTLPPTTNDNKMQTLQLTDTPPLSFNTVLSVSFFLNFCAWGCFYICHYQTVMKYLENKLIKSFVIQNKVVYLYRYCN